MNITNVLRLSGPILQTFLVALLIKQGAHRKFRFFVAYSLFAISIETIKFALYGRALLFFCLFWSAEAVYAILGFAALQEAFHRLFGHLYHIRSVRCAFPVTALLVLILSALWIVVHGQPAHAILLLLRVIFALEFAVRLLQMGFFVVIIGVAVCHHSYMRRWGFGVAAGFGVSASGMFAATVVRSEFGISYSNLLKLLPPITYLIAVLVWLLEFARPEPPEPVVEYRQHDPWQVLERLRQLRRQAEQILRPFFANPDLRRSRD